MADKDLWAAVLHQAIDDALKGVPSVMAKNRASRVLMTTQAREYLTKPSKDLATVCAFAGVDMEAVIDRMLKQIAAAPTPEELIGTYELSPTHEKKPRAQAIQDRASCASPVQREARTLKKWSKRTITHEGETLTYRQWAERTGLSWFTIRDRHKKGWPVDAVLRLDDLRGAPMKADPD